MSTMKLSETLFNVMHLTKSKMLDYYRVHDAESIREEYYDFRNFSRFLFIRGDIPNEAVRVYVNTKMLNFKDMLLKDEKWS